MRRIVLALLLLRMASIAPLGGISQVNAAGRFLNPLFPQKKVQTNTNEDYTLLKEHGPWLVMAASFSGEQGETDARELVLELRSKFNLPAFHYGMTFQLSEGNPGRGIDNYGGRIKRRYQRGDEVIQYAVLVGHFPSLNDPEAQRTLHRIKQLKPDCLLEPGEKTSQSLATVRQFHSVLRKKIGKSDAKGPMGHAFLTRNPMLPREFFAPQGIDKEVAKWNKDLPYSLMKCPGNYSIRVATFKGRTSLKAANKLEDQSKLGKPSSALVAAAENAHFLTTALREKGWEAYEFHDRQESYVAVGSFREATTTPNGGIFLRNPDAKTIIDTFGARTPMNIFNRPAQQDLALEQQQKARFQQLFKDSQGQVSQGLFPKRFVGLPFDIDPKPVRVPRESISSVYARN